jgi:hypothetical protein
MTYHNEKDDLDRILEEQWKDPAFRASYIDAMRKNRSQRMYWSRAEEELIMSSKDDPVVQAFIDETYRAHDGMDAAQYAFSVQQVLNVNDKGSSLKHLAEKYFQDGTLVPLVKLDES